MRKYIIVALLLVAAGIGVSFFLLPDAQDVQIAQARDQQTINMGNIDLEAEYNQGRRSFQIIDALAQKRVGEGKPEEALKLWEEYVAANPIDGPGRAKLAEAYADAGRMDDYNTHVAALAGFEANEENLFVLSQAYHAGGQYGKQAETLDRLITLTNGQKPFYVAALAEAYNADKNYAKQVETLKRLLEMNQGREPGDFAALATMQTVIGDYDGALKTLDDLKAKHPNYTSYAVTRIRVTILTQQDKSDEAVALAKQWIDAAPVPTTPTEVPPSVTPNATVSAPPTKANQTAIELGDLCDIINYGGHPDKAIELVQPHEAWIDTSSELAVAYVNANINANRTDYAYQLLSDIEAKNKMVPQLYILYMQLTLKKGDTEAAEGIANRLKIEDFNEEQALNLVEVARLANAQSVIDILSERFNGNAEVIKNKPVLAAVLAILTNAQDQDAKIDVALNTHLSSLQRLRLAESCARAQKTACFDTILSQYPPVDQQSNPQIVEYAQLYIIANRPEDVIDPVGLQAAKPTASPEVVLAHVRLAAAAGRKDITAPWLEANANTVPVQQLQDLFFLANDRKHSAVASDIAERLYARDPSPMNRDILIAALVGSGQHAKALPLVREQMQQGGTDDTMYIATLSQAARKDPAARKELTDYAEASLKSGKGDDKAQLNYAYTLLNNGRRDAAMPYINAYAKDRGGEWKRMQAQLMAKPGTPGAAMKKLSREERVAMAANPKMSDENKRQIAYSLLNDGHKADAVAIFQQIAATKPADSKEVKDLLYIWGGKLNAEQMAWVQSRAASAPPYDKEKWAALINSYGDDQAVVQYVSSTPDALYSSALRKRYFNVLAQTGNKQYFDQGMRDWVNQTTDVNALLDYSNTALAYNYQDAALNGYKRVEQLDPNNTQAMDKLAILTYSKGSYSQAAPYIDRAIASNQAAPSAEVDPAQAHFLKAEMFKRAGNLQAAQQEYSAVISYTQSVPTQDPSKLSRLYMSMFNTNQHQQAMQGFNSLLAAYPDDKGILADYMSALIEYKYFDEATRIANQYDKNSPYYGRGAMLNGESRNVSAIQRMSDGREMKISFSKPTADAMPIDAEQAQKLAWVERTEVGYDSVTISAKPGYIVRYVPTAQDQFAVVSMPVEEVSPQVQAQRDQDLRLQLLYARIEQETGQQDRAKQRLMALQQYYPQNSALLVSRAGIESAEGNREEALSLVRAAQVYNPSNEDLGRLERDLAYAPTGSTSRMAQFVKLDGEYRSYGPHEEFIETLSGMINATDSTQLGFMVQNDSMSPENMVLPSTGALTSNNTSRQQVELLMAHYFDGGNRIQGSLFADSGYQVGGGLYYGFDNALGRTEVLGEYHKPYWDYPSAVFAYANRDRVGFRHVATINPKLSMGLEGSLNNYNIKYEDDQVQTGLFRMSLAYALQEKTEDQAYFGLGYGFDGEYKIGDHNSQNGAFGVYHPFDWRSREVHFISGVYQDDWTPTTHAMLVAGYAVDRLNEDGPSFDARVTEDLTDQWELGVRGHYGFQSNEAENDAVNVGAHLMYKF